MTRQVMQSRDEMKFLHALYEDNVQEYAVFSLVATVRLVWDEMKRVVSPRVLIPRGIRSADFTETIANSLGTACRSANYSVS